VSPVSSSVPPAPASLIIPNLPMIFTPGQHPQHPSELKSIEKMVNGLDIKPELGVVKSGGSGGGDPIDK
jgi:hypothetical protein